MERFKIYTWIGPGHITKYMGIADDYNEIDAILRGRANFKKEDFVKDDLLKQELSKYSDWNISIEPEDIGPLSDREICIYWVGPYGKYSRPYHLYVNTNNEALKTFLSSYTIPNLDI